MSGKSDKKLKSLYFVCNILWRKTYRYLGTDSMGLDGPNGKEDILSVSCFGTGTILVNPPPPGKKHTVLKVQIILIRDSASFASNVLLINTNNPTGDFYPLPPPTPESRRQNTLVFYTSFRTEYTSCVERGKDSARYPIRYLPVLRLFKTHQQPVPSIP